MRNCESNVGVRPERLTMNEADRFSKCLKRFEGSATGFIARLALCVAMGVASLASAADGKLDALEEQAFKQAAALADPCIVRIETVGGLEQVENILLANGPTTGVVVSSDGYIITSSFNFVSKPASILVTLADGRHLAAKLVSNDRLRLLTLLKVDATGLTPAKPVPRDQIKVGQWALALGRTLDNSMPSVSVGIVSAVNRVWGKAIQTDAKTSPVNYGGALVDIEGRVMGVIAPLSPTGGSEMAGVEWYDGGIGFAIPLDDIYASLDHLKQGTDLLPGLMGISFTGGQSLNIPSIVDRVRYNSPAQQAGLKAKDKIIEADGEKIIRIAQLKQVMGRKYAGESVKLLVSRGDQTIPLELTLVGQLIPYETPFLGILPERSKASPNAGVGVRFVFAKSPAQMAGLSRGDRVVKFNSVEVADAAALTNLVSRSRPGERVPVTYVRDGAEATADVTLGSYPEEVVAELPAEATAAPGKVDEGDAKATPEPNADNKTAELKTGRFTANLEGHDHDYWAYVPDGYRDRQSYGLVVWIHPAGDTMEAAVYKQWKSICDRRGLILVGPKAEKLQGWLPGETEFIKALIGHFREKYSIDASRIVFHSFGNGAGMTSLFGAKHREIVRGIALTGAPFLGSLPENEPDLRQQFLFACGDTDKLLPRVKQVVGELRKMKFPVSFNTVKGLGAKYPDDAIIDEIGRWVDSIDRI